MGAEARAAATVAGIVDDNEAVAAALWHQVGRRDELQRCMGFGRHRCGTAGPRSDLHEARDNYALLNPGHEALGSPGESSRKRAIWCMRS